MLTRANIAGFLQGFFVMLLSAAFGGLVALLFHTSLGTGWACVAVCALVPLAGAIKTRQGALLAGLLAGILMIALAYLGAHSHP